MIVIKRDGSIEPFCIGKIEAAVTKAFEAVGEPINADILEEIEDELYIEEGITVEELQDQIEQALFELGYFEVAKAFILYREEHKNLRFLKDRCNYIDKYATSDDNAATSSETDGNANVSMKNVANLEAEVYKSINRQIQRYRMEKKLAIMYPEVSKMYSKDLEHHIIYVHDESSSPVPKYYCKAITLYPLLIDGTSKMDGLGTEPPHNLNSFCGQFINLMFLCSSQCKGAVGCAEFFNFFDYFCAKEWGEDYYLKDDTMVTANRTIKDTIEQAFQNVVYSINQPAGNRSYQSPFINFNYFDSYYWESLFGDFVFPDGSKPKWESVSYLQKLFMKWFNKERSITLLTYPVESMCLLTDGSTFKDKEYADFTAEMWSEGHSFFVYTSDNPDAVASCCRLRNNVTSNTFSSTTGLTGVSTGSCNVITLNISRIIQDCSKAHGMHGGWRENTSFIVEYLRNILKRVYKYQVTYKTILYEWADKGMFSSVNAGFIDFSKLYSTTGINGINEAAMFLGMEVSNNPDYKDFVTLVLGTIKDFNTEHTSKKFMLNLEIVPAEGLGSKNYNWDKEDNYWVPDDRVLYNSYIYDAHDNTSILDKFILQGGAIAKSCDGGQAVHCNLEEHLSKEQYLKLMHFAIAQGTSYYTFNIPNTQCDDCKHITKRPVTECPICGSKNVTQWTRVIGFLRPIKGFDKYRQIEAAERTYHSNNVEIC